MLDLRYVVDNLEEVRKALGRRGPQHTAVLDEVAQLRAVRSTGIQARDAKIQAQKAANEAMAKAPKGTPEFAAKREELKALSAQMMSYWAEFAYAGAPGRGRDQRLPEWTPWDSSAPAAPKFMVFDTPAGGGVRMSADAITTATVLAAVDDDPRLPAQRDKCTIYYALAHWSRGFSKKDYPTAGCQGCKEYPSDAYPWG